MATTTGTNKLIVKKYMGNVGKSIKTEGLKMLKSQFFPNLTSTWESTSGIRDVLKEASKDRLTPTAIGKAIASHPAMQDINQGFKNALEDIKSGNWVNTEREDKAMEDAFGFDDSDFGMDFDTDISDNYESTDEFGEDDIFDPTKNISMDAKLGASITQKSMAKSTSIISDTVAKSSRASAGMLIQYDKAKTTAMSTMLSGLFGKTNESLGIINDNLANLLSFHNTVTKEYYTNSLNIMEETRRHSQDIAGYMKEFVEMERNKYQDFLNSKSGNSKESMFNQAFGFQGIDVNSWLKNIKNNAMPSTGMDGGMLKMLMASPLSIPLSMMLPSLLSSGTKKLFKSIDSLFGDFPKAMNYRFRNMKNGTGIGGLIGRLLYMDNSVSSKMDTSKYIKGPIPFDGETKKAIIGDIAPTLRRIEAALTGQPYKNFNLAEGKYETIKDTKKRYDERTKSALTSGFTDTKSFIRNQIGRMTDNNKLASQLNDDMELVLQEIVKSNLSYDPSNKNHRLKGVNPRLQKFANQLLLTMDARTRNRFITELEETRGSANSNLKDLQENFSQNGFGALFDGSLGIDLNKGRLKGINGPVSPTVQLLSDIRKVVSTGMNVYVVDNGPFKYKFKPVKGQGLGIDTNNILNALPKVDKRVIKSNNYEDDGIWNNINGFDKNVDSRLEKASDRIEDWKYRMITGAPSMLEDNEAKSIVEILRKMGKAGLKGLAGAELAKVTKFANRFKMTPKDLMNMVNIWDSIKSTASSVWTKTKDTSKDWFNKAIDFAMPGFRGMDPEKKKEYLNQLKGKAKNFGKIAGGSIMAGMMMGSPLIGILGATAGFISQSDRMKDWLFGAVGENGERKGGKISKKMQDFMKSSAKAMGIGALSGLIGGGLFLNSFGIAGPFLGAGLGMLSRSEKFQNWLFGGVGEDGEREGGLISKNTQKLFKQYAPAGIGGLLSGGIAGRLLGLGPIGAISLGMVGSGLGIAMKSEKVQSWLFGGIGEDGKRKNDGVVSKVQKYAKENMATIGGAGAGLLLGGLQFGPLGALMMGAVGAGSGFLASSEGFKKWLFGDKDPETGKRKGGLLDTVTVNVKDWFKTSISAPFKEALGPLKSAFHDMTDNIKGMFKAGWDTFQKSIGGIFADSVGKPLKEIFDEKIGKPIKGFLTKIIMGSGRILGAILSAPVKGISAVAKALSGKDKEADKEIKAQDSTFGKLNIGKSLKESISGLMNKFTLTGAGMFGALSMFSSNNEAKNKQSSSKASLKDRFKSVFGKVKGHKQSLIDRIRSKFRKGSSKSESSGVEMVAPILAMASEEEGSDDSEDDEQSSSSIDPIIGNIVGKKKRKKKNKIKSAIGDAASKSSGLLSGVFSKIFKGGKLKPSNDVTPATLTSGTLININQYLPAIHNTLLDIKKGLTENKYLKGIYDEVHGQLDGLGFNTETITNILEEHFGSPKKLAKQMKGDRGNRKRKGIIGRILSFVMAPISFMLGKPLKFLKGVGGGILGSLLSILKAPINLLGGLFSTGKKAIEFMATLGKNIFAPFKFAFNMLTKAIGGVKDVINTSIKVLGGMLTTALQTVGSVVKEAVTTVGTGIKEGFKVIGTTLTSFIPLLAQGSAALARGAWNVIKGTAKGAWALGSATLAKVMKIPLIGFKTMDVNIVKGTVDKVKTVEKIKEVETVTFTKSVGGVGRDYIKKSTKGIKLNQDDKRLIELSGAEDKKEEEMRQDIKTMAKGGILGKLSGMLVPVLGALAGLIPGLTAVLGMKGVDYLKDKGDEYRDNLAKDGSISEFEKDFRDKTHEGRKWIKIGGLALWGIKKMGNSKLGKVIKTGGNLLGKVLKKLVTNSKVSKLLGPLKNILVKNIGKITAKFGKLFAKNATGQMAKKAGKGFLKTIRTATKSIPLAGWLIEGGFFVNDFITGFTHPNRFLNVPASVNPTSSMRLACGIGYALSSFIFEADAAFRGEDEVRPIIDWLYQLFADDEEEQKTKEDQERLKAEYEEYKKTHPDVSFDKFNRMQNGTHWEKLTDKIVAVGSSIKGTYDKVKGGIVSFGKGAWDLGVKAWEGMKSLGSSIIQGIKDSFKSAKEYVGKKIDGIVASVVSLPSQIGEAISNMGKKIKNTARDLKNKTVKGVKDAYNWVTNLNARQDYGMGGFISQGGLGNLDMTIPGDARRVSAKDVGCGPASFTMAMNAMGKNVDMRTMSQIARGYREPNDGTNYQMFSDVSSMYGIPSQTGDISSGVLNDLKSGKPTILMGASNSERNSNNPFGKNMHYVMADRFENGKIRINDPMSNKPKYMDARTVLKNTKKATRFGMGVLEGERSTQSDPIERVFNKIFNKMILKYTGKVKYRMGAKNPDRGTVDCSGWVQYIMAEVIRLGKMEGIQFPNDWVTQWTTLLNTYGAAGMLQFANTISGLSMNNIDYKDLKPGMLVGLVTYTNRKELHRTASRPFNISHILMVIRDSSGQIKLTESRSGKGIVTSNPKERIEAEIKRGNVVYIGDPFGFMRTYPNYFEKRDSSGAVDPSQAKGNSSGGTGIVGKFWNTLLGSITGLDKIGVSVGDLDPVSGGTTSSVERNGIDLSGVDFSKLSTKNIKFTSDNIKNRRAQFVADRMIPLSKEFGQDPAIGLAQWAFESSWGAKESGKHNLFGIKATGRPNKYWDGSKSNVATHEYVNGKKVSIKDGFRNYSSMDNSIRDYYRLIKEKYPKVATIGAKGLAGYSTTPSYINDIEKQGNRFRRLIAENLGMKFGSGIDLASILGSNKLTSVIDNTVGKAQGGLNNLLGGIMGQVDKASSGITGVTGKVNTAIDQASGRINDITNIDGIKDSISGGISGITGSITGGINSLVDIPASAIGNLNNSVKGGIDSVVGGVTGGISSVTDTITGIANIPNQIAGQVSSAIDQTVGTLTETIKENLNVGGVAGVAGVAILSKQLNTVIHLLQQVVTNTMIFKANENDLRFAKVRSSVGLPVDHPYDDGSTIDLTKQIVKRQYI